MNYETVSRSKHIFYPLQTPILFQESKAPKHVTLKGKYQWENLPHALET
jgi:hypothetical protein